MAFDFKKLNELFKAAEDRIAGGMKLINDKKVPETKDKRNDMFRNVMNPYERAKEQYNELLQKHKADKETKDGKAAVDRYQKLLKLIGDFRTKFPKS